jgi:glycyl-tRNA synthetase alpha chain
VGWQVWLDGLEITQFTYFQQAGGIELSPVSVELTYGLERIAMAIQKVSHYAELEWAAGVSYGELYRRAEWEWSRYSFEEAPVEGLQANFQQWEKEARGLLASGGQPERDPGGLVYPAYELVLKCSHAFNLLDARRALSVRERASYVGRVRALARAVAQAYLRQREELGFPLRPKEKGKVSGE